MDLETPLQPKCTVSGVLNFILRLSQIAGIAPIKFERVRGSWRIRVSRIFYCYDLLVVIVIQIFSALSYLRADDDIIDGYESSSNTTFMGILTKILFIMQCTVGIVVVYTNYNRFQHVIDCVERLEQIDQELHVLFRPMRQTSETKMWSIVILAMIHGYIGSFAEYSFYLMDVIASNDTVPFKWYAFASVYVFLVYLQLYSIEFFLIVMKLVSHQKRLNECFKRLLQKPYNKSIKIDPKILETLANIYCSLCDIMRELNASNGIPLIMLLVFVFVNWVNLPYFIVSTLYNVQSSFSIAKVVASLGFNSVGITMLILVTEPCHRAQDQLYLTKDLVAQMVRLVPREALAVNYELKIFKRHIILNPISFYPLQLMKFDRYLLVSVLTTAVAFMSFVIRL